MQRAHGPRSDGSDRRRSRATSRSTPSTARCLRSRATTPRPPRSPRSRAGSGGAVRADRERRRPFAVRARGRRRRACRVRRADDGSFHRWLDRRGRSMPTHVGGNDDRGRPERSSQGDGSRSHPSRIPGLRRLRLARRKADGAAEGRQRGRQQLLGLHDRLVGRRSRRRRFWTYTGFSEYLGAYDIFAAAIDSVARCADDDCTRPATTLFVHSSGNEADKNGPGSAPFPSPSSGRQRHDRGGDVLLLHERERHRLPDPSLQHRPFRLDGRGALRDRAPSE